MSKRNPVVYDDGKKGRPSHKRFPKGKKQVKQEKKVGGNAG